MKIGLEIHVELNSKSKIFCSCATQGSNVPNTRTCEICLGMPGSKPSFNREVLHKALKVALALGCKINKESFFSRKNYFYPDMTKNFQITQYELPLAENGKFEGINIRRIHMEEDPGALIHFGSITLIDYNRSGMPLIEIVTEPDFKTPKEARTFLNKLITLLEYLNVYVREEETTLKADANISLEGGERVEIKNVTGLREIERCLEYEAKRQEIELATFKETRGWDAEKGVTYSLRKKESENDYGYLTECDLPMLELSDTLLNEIKKEIPELPNQKIKNFIDKYKLNKDDAEVIASDLKLAELFEQISHKIDAKIAANYLRRDLLGQLEYNKLQVKDLKIGEHGVKDIGVMLNLYQKNKINNNILKTLTIRLIKEGKIGEIKEQVSDDSQLKKWCKEAIENNKSVVEDYKKGNENSLNFLVGYVMKLSNKSANPQKVREILKEMI
ncbi:Asp-tRNA(Asn)/Glu-tRNA(Gln) amidotransferase subunit GatB [Candidatus Woesearchaeota archaeon]|nr:Asp-tRNA(Asn)/Glu-tRNA(Gln) amidotransferase subunit GatB [Candidatus Woesearchaeota archaeon]